MHFDLGFKDELTFEVLGTKFEFLKDAFSKKYEPNFCSSVLLVFFVGESSYTVVGELGEQLSPLRAAAAAVWSTQ